MKKKATTKPKKKKTSNKNTEYWRQQLAQSESQLNSFVRDRGW